MLSGPDFVAAADGLPLAGLCAALFTLSYLIATFLAAIGDRRGIWLIACFVPVQLGCYAWYGLSETGIGLHDMVAAKAICQAALALAILALAGKSLRQRPEFKSKS